MEHAAERREHPAIVVEAGERISYAELNARINRAVAALRRLGVQRGDRVALALRSEPLYLELYFACAKLGAILVPLNTRLTAAELGFQITDCGAAVVIRSPEIELGALSGTRCIEREAFVALRPATAPEPALAPGGENPQVILYTSGTTGVPKGAVLPYRKTLFNTLNAEIYFGLRETDVAVVPIPLFHSFGLNILSVPVLFAGATLVLVDHFDALTLQDTLARERATFLGAVPVMYRRMLEAGVSPEKWSSLRFAFGAGAPLEVETIRRFHELGVPLLQGYGQTETSILCCLDPKNALDQAGSVGRPVRYAEVRVAAGDGREQPRGTSGEVVVRGPIVMTGYWRRPQETAATRLDGWHRTGDLGVMDADGFLTLVGRLKELYISGGENVYPAEVERVLAQHPAVAEAAVVGVPDERWGESGRAYVVPAADDFDADELLGWARARLAKYKLPREVVLVDELPRTASGKVQKHVLLEEHPG